MATKMHKSRKVNLELRKAGNGPAFAAAPRVVGLHLIAYGSIIPYGVNQSPYEN
jgi:hypothetical protein